MPDMTFPRAAPFYTAPSGKRCIYYHTSWSNYARDFQVKDLPIGDVVTDVAYAFFNVASNGAISSGDQWADFQNPFIGKGVDPPNTWDSPPSSLGNFGQFAKLRKAGKRFNLALAIGGWTWSARLSDAMATQASRDLAVQSLVDIMMQWPGLFNGVTIDWEYLSDDGINYGLAGNAVRTTDPANLCLFLKALRKALGPGFRLAMCVTAAPEKIKMPVASVHPLLDELHIMTYDFADGNWGLTTSGHHTNLRPTPYCPYSIEQAVAAWKALGAPAAKLFIGAALYSRGFSNTDGIGKPASGGSLDMSWESGVVDYKALPIKGATEHWDPMAQATYSYDPQRRVLNSYDSVQSVNAKCAFIRSQGLAGLIVWDSSGDQPCTNPRSLMKAIHATLNKK